MVINIQPILISTTISLLLTEGIQTIINFPTLITIGCVEMFAVGLLGYLVVSKYITTTNNNS